MTSPGGRSSVRRVLAVAPPRWRSVALAVLAGAAAAGCSIALLATSGFLLSRAALRPPVLELMVAIVAVRFFGLGRGVFRYLERLATHDAALRLLGTLRMRFFQRLEPLAPGGLGPYRRGDLLARAVGDVETLQFLTIRGIVPPLVAAVVAPLVVAVAWALLPAAGGVLLAGLAVAGTLVPLGAAAARRRARARQAEARGELSSAVVDLLEGAPELLAAGRLDDRLEGVGAADRTLARLARADAALVAAVTGAGVLVAGVTTWLTVVVAVPAVGDGRLQGVLLAALVLLVLTAFDAVSPVALSAREMGGVQAAARRLFAVTDTPAPVVDPVAPRALPAGAGVVVLEGAGLRYEPDGPPALVGVDLRLAPGRRVVVVGPSGAGKTTIAHVLLRFRELESGRMTVGGIDARELAQDDVRGVVGLAGQDAHLFDTTIAQNVRLARPGAADEEVAEALAAAHVWDWVRSLPDGMATRVGERGARVSGGERQRIALARVLLAGTPVVVLDEPFANLDLAAADALLVDILAATAGRALLLVTHRLAGLDAFDEVVVLDAGRVVERGTHAELLAAGGLYRQLWDLEIDAYSAGLIVTASPSPMPSSPAAERRSRAMETSP